MAPSSMLFFFVVDVSRLLWSGYGMGLIGSRCPGVGVCLPWMVRYVLDMYVHTFIVQGRVCSHLA